MIVAIIPARGGSKRIPRKNLKSFHGKPIISYSIETAIASNCFDKVIVSTDDPEIAKVSKDWGADVPFVRPDNISNDHATTLEVIQHAINWCEQEGWNLSNVCCVYPTAPLLLPDDIINGLRLIRDLDVQYVFSATTFEFPIQRAIYLDDSYQLKMFQPEHLNTRSQDLKVAYHDAGQFYWGKADAFKAGLPILANHSKFILLPNTRVQDIDTEEDWVIAELKYKVL